jgi:hypothetical protein
MWPASNDMLGAASGRIRRSTAIPWKASRGQTTPASVVRRHRRLLFCPTRSCHPIKPNSFERERIVRIFNSKSQISSANFRMATWCSGQGRKCLGGRKPVAEHEIGGPAWKVQPSRSQTLRQALRGRAKRGDLESSRRNERRTNLQCSCRRTTQLILARSVEWRLIC